MKIASSSPALLPKCFISCDSLVPAWRAIADVLVCSYPRLANKVLATRRMRSWVENPGAFAGSGDVRGTKW